MTLNVTLEFRDTKIPELTDDISVIRVELWQEMSEAFSLVVQLRSRVPQIDMTRVVSEVARVHFFRDESRGAEAEPYLPTVEGMVRRGRQLAAMHQGDMSTYELVIVHQLWLLTRRKSHGIHQQTTIPDLVEQRIERRNALSRVKIPAPKLPAQATRKREYIVQYGETDYDFYRRTLAEDGIAFYFTGAGLETPTLVSDTSATRSSVQPTLPYRPSAGALQGTEDAVIEIEFGSSFETTGKLLRDYNFDNPRFHPEGLMAAGTKEPLPSYADYSYEEGSLHAFDGGKDKLLGEADCNAIAQRRLEDLLKTRWTAECRTTCPLPVGAVLTVTGDHPIANTPLTVVRSLTVLESPDEARATHARQLHRVTCVDASFPFRPRQIPKPRIHGIQRATVVGPEHIHVDEHGRVLLAFFWHIDADEITNPEATDLQLTRRVQVSQAWAGPSHGIVTLPRCGDEVLVAYVDGDPDEPIVVGRVYNGINRGEVKLPDDKTQSLWRTESSPGRNGFHEIRFEDRSGSEELHIEAERLHTRLVKGNEQINVNGSRSCTVTGSETERIGGSRLTSAGGEISRSSSDHYIKVKGKANVKCDTRDIDCTGNHTIHCQEQHTSAKAKIALDAPLIEVTGGMRILLKVGGSSIDINPAMIKITAPLVLINS